MNSKYYRVDKVLLSLFLVIAIVFSAISFLTIDTHAYITNAYNLGIPNPEPTNYFQLGQYRLNLYKNVTYEVESVKKELYWGTLNNAAYRFYNYYNVDSKWRVTIKSITFTANQWPQKGNPRNDPGKTITSTALSGNITKPSNWVKAQIIPGDDLYNIGATVTVKFYLTNDKTKKIYTKSFINKCSLRAEYYV